MYFWLYAVVMFWALLFFGSSAGSVLLGLAFAIHVASAGGVIIPRSAKFGSRLAIAMACAALLLLGFYVPIGVIVSHFAVPIQLQQNTAIFAADDVIWYTPVGNVASGDYVLYAVPRTWSSRPIDRAPEPAQIHRIDRVVAVWGQRVSERHGLLTIDDVEISDPTPARVAAELGAGFAVPEGYLFIPGLVPPTAAVGRAAWQQRCAVPRENVVGRIFFRSQPLWRMSMIRGWMNGSKQ